MRSIAEYVTVGINSLQRVVNFIQETHTVRMMKRYGPISLAVEVVQLYFPTENLMHEVF